MRICCRINRRHIPWIDAGIVHTGGDRAGGGRHGRELSRSRGYFDRHGLEICGGAGSGRNAGTSAIDPVQETHEAKA